MWRATVLTIFPEMYPGALGSSIAGKARENGLWSLQTIDVRDRSNGRIYTGTVAEDVIGSNGSVMIPRGAAVELLVQNIGENDMAIDIESVSHRAILEACVAHDPDAAAKALEAHLDAFRRECEIALAGLSAGEATAAGKPGA